MPSLRKQPPPPRETPLQLKCRHMTQAPPIRCMHMRFLIWKRARGSRHPGEGGRRRHPAFRATGGMFCGPVSIVEGGEKTKALGRLGLLQSWDVHLGLWVLTSMSFSAVPYCLEQILERIATISEVGGSPPAGAGWKPLSPGCGGGMSSPLRRDRVMRPERIVGAQLR
uniref:uncharacterized protein LOC118524253 isoform X2 n=1 Tax=Halichoerus grypus TaxID=9711 RepID=UPI001659CE2D|nr:uncharacterized protein LOC118524253 isoform X2 [Halichoerus grypus]